MNAEDYLKELSTVLDDYRFDEVGPLTDKIDPSQFKPREVKKALGLLRRKRLFAQLEKAAGLFYLAGHQMPQVRRQWAQALLDMGRIKQGLVTLKNMVLEVAADTEEGMEVNGLIGRAYKQLYVENEDPQNLIKAIQAYHPGWLAREGDYRWHGINLAALLARAERDGCEPQCDDQYSEIAVSIMADIEDLEHKAMVWDYATAMETAIALNDQDAVLRWAKQYATHPGADAFELASTLRQLKEVWQLDGTELGNKLIPVLEYELLQREGGVLEPTSLQVIEKGGFEAVYGSENSIHMQWMDSMYQSALSVARIGDSKTGENYGTGFLIKGEQLNSEWSDEPILVTNSHVISINPADEAPLQPETAVAEFTRLAARPKVKLGELLFSSPRVELDISVFQLNAPAGAELLEVSRYPPALAKVGDKPQRIYVIGHPKGAELAVSLYDNNLVGYEDNYVHYRSPTEGGSSGSPVFNRKWELFALHHRTRMDLQANEGVLFEAIKQAAAKCMQ